MVSIKYKSLQTGFHLVSCHFIDSFNMIRCPLNDYFDSLNLVFAFIINIIIFVVIV